MIQIICGIILVLIGVLVFWKYPIKSDTKSLTLAALFIVLAAVLKRLSIMVPLFGVEALKISIEVIPMILAGMMLSPSYCYIIGLSIDLIGLIVTPTGFPFLGFTLSCVLQCLIPAMVVQIVKEKYEKSLEHVIRLVLLVLAIGATVYIFTLNEVSISKQLIKITLGNKLMLSAICLIMISILFILMYYFKKKLNDQEYHNFNIWMISVVLVELLVTFILTPYWLQVMYGIPFMVSLFIRVIKACIMIPVDIILGYSLLRILKRL